MTLPNSIRDRETEKFFSRKNKTYVRTGDDGFNEYFNTLEVKKSTVTSAATKITTPDNSGNFILIHKSQDTLYIGDSSVTTSTGYPVERNDAFKFDEFKANDENEIYAICESGVSIDVYALAGIKE